MSCWQNIQLCCGACRICLYTVFQWLCCKKPVVPKAEYSLVCIGLTKAGKTTLLSLLCNENTDNITATTGFVIKPCQFKNCILQIKEIGGGEKQRQFWRHYYHDAQAIVFVIDSACSDDEMDKARIVLHDALADPNLAGLPCLLLANCQDKIGARTEQQVDECLDLPSVCAVRPCELSLCSATKDDKHIRDCFESFIDHHLSPHPTQPAPTRCCILAVPGS